ncbi:YkuS family protein [Aquibacillus salsiterrae]|uniref:UPF0180 protein NC799_06380 n=1 Tax=Aquibacillus salsiterrae TaxID=2950439 RepID=A0A9X3WDN7_9BACI|nr:YkuS family protein [Aquibacillus salsiterrae]MDC3416541.1 YkuS family protein [Aquibacillus salsiterrae]
MARIGIEQSLSNVKGALEEKGYETIELKNEQDANSCDCCVISGQDKDVMGIQTASFSGSVINAEGMSADEVVKEVQDRVK